MCRAVRTVDARHWINIGYCFNTTITIILSSSSVEESRECVMCDQDEHAHTERRFFLLYSQQPIYRAIHSVGTAGWSKTASSPVGVPQKNKQSNFQKYYLAFVGNWRTDTQVKFKNIPPPSFVSRFIKILHRLQGKNKNTSKEKHTLVLVFARFETYRWKIKNH